MKISMLGSRGIPAHYSGVETCVENLAVRLAERGHDVSVYCRPHSVDWTSDMYKGVRLVRLPTVRNKFLDTLVHTALSTIHMGFFRRPDVALYSIAGNSPVVLLAQAFGIPTAFNVDGLDSQRAKWGAWARRYLQAAEWLSARVATQTITDSKVVQSLYEARFHRPSTFIAYGAELDEPTGDEVLVKFGLTKRNYLLIVKRMVPENGVLEAVQAYANVKTTMPLVVVGDGHYANDYMAKVHQAAGPNVIFAGSQFGDSYRQLLFNAFLCIEPSVVGGTHPALIEAMAAGNFVIATNHAPHVEALGEAGVTYDMADPILSLTETLRDCFNDLAMIESFRQKAKKRALKLYSWDRVTDEYERLFQVIAAPDRWPGVPVKTRPRIGQ